MRSGQYQAATQKVICLQNSTINIPNSEIKNCCLAVSYFNHPLYFTYELGRLLGLLEIPSSKGQNIG
jgi:hypothetical protein